MLPTTRQYHDWAQRIAKIQEEVRSCARGRTHRAPIRIHWK